MKEEIIQTRLKLARETNKLDLSDLSVLDEIPAELYSLKDLKVLNLEGHHIQYLPEDLFGLTALEELNLAGDLATPGLKRLPDKISRLKNLRRLNLSRNGLQNLPPAICHLSHLKLLALNDNGLRELPEDIRCLVELKELFLSDNQLRTLPDSLSKLNQLVGLYMQHNQLEHLPATLGDLEQLERLNLSYNKLSDIPLSLRNLRRLKFFDLRNNPLLQEKKFPAEIFAQYNLPSVILHELEIQFEDLDENEVPLAEAKLILLGDGRVGKTTLVNQLVHDAYKEPEGTTKGVNITQLDLEDLPLRLNIWDFAGQAIMHATHQLFLTKYSIYLVVLNARQEVQEERLHYWLNVIMSFAGENATILVIINGIDGQNRLYLDQRGLKKTYGIRDFIETSATEGIGINKLRNKITDLAKELPMVQRRVKLSWKTVRRLVEKRIRSLTLENMLWADFQNICQARQIKDVMDQKSVLELLHEIGVVFSPKYHGADKDNTKPLILNPHQLTQSIYELQSSRETLKAQRDDGRVSPDELDNILTEINMSRPHWKLLKPIMQQYDLCIELNDKNLVFTCLLPPEEPALSFSEDRQSTQFTYRYNFLPASVLPRFIGELLRSKKDEPVIIEELWQKGVCLQTEATRLFMRIEPGSRRVDLTFFGKEALQRKKLLEQVRLILGQVHDQIAYLKVEQFVPVTDDKGNEQLIPYDHLLILQIAGHKEFIPYGSHNTVDVQPLLNAVEHTHWERRQLRDLIKKYFNLEELRDLCFDLNINHDNLPNHQTTGGLSREIILYMERRGRMEELVSECKANRPNFQWSTHLIAP